MASQGKSHVSKTWKVAAPGASIISAADEPYRPLQKAQEWGNLGVLSDNERVGQPLFSMHRGFGKDKVDVPYPLISDVARGRCLPFIGAGFSKNAHLPQGQRMPDWSELRAILAGQTKSEESVTALGVAQRYEEEFGRVQLIETIRDSLHMDKARPGRSHKAFVSLPFGTIYTTNFDLLLEEAYSKEARPFRSLVGELQLPFHAGQAASTIIKMHGDLRHEEHIIVTQNDYDHFLERYPVVATHLSAMLITRTPLFLGYSLSDPDFQNIRNVVRSRLGAFERMAYVVQFDVLPEQKEQALRDRVHIISLTSDASLNRDELLAALFEAIQENLDTKAGLSLRSSRPDAFEEVQTHVIEKALQTSDQSPIIEATSRLCFVLMPLEEKFDSVYRKLIGPAVRLRVLWLCELTNSPAPDSSWSRFDRLSSRHDSV